ncbi:MAG TPA: two-component regulator propeller domain-containing protein [Puia sp.]|nr:two-component regulator propeller domain-containing protein [Puia sp.]
MVRNLRRLNRYDGYGFTVYRNVIGDSSSIPFNQIATISADGHNRLWIGGQKGITVYDPETNEFTRLAYLSCDGRGRVEVRENIHVVAAVGRDMLAGSHTSGLLVFPYGTRTGQQIALKDAKSGKGSYDVFCIEPDPSGQRAWIFLQGRGLYVFDLRTASLLPVNNTLRQCFSLKVDHQGRVWAGSDNGLQYFDSARGSWSENVLPQRTRVVSITVERNNDLCLGTDGSGLWRLRAADGKTMPLLSATGAPLVNSNAVYSICMDKDGRKWVGTLRGGISVIEPQKSTFTTFTVPGHNNPIDNFILSFCEEKDHNVWIGTDGAGLRLWNRRTGTFKAYVHDPSKAGSICNNFITGILRDSRDRLWVSTWFEGIDRFNRGTGTFSHFSCFNPETNVEEKHIWNIIEDRDGRIWACATNEGSLYLFNEARQRFELFDDRIQDLQVLFEDREGNLWGGNYSSLIRIDREHKHHQVFPMDYTVRSLHEDRWGRFWVGTQEGGLLLFDCHSGKYQRFTTANGLPDNTVLRILEDAEGNLWMSTYNGLSEYLQKERRFRNFSTSDGLQSMQYSFNAALTLSTGEMLFGGIKGFNLFMPDSVHRPTGLPEIYLTGVRVRNEAVGGKSSYVTGTTDGAITDLKVPFNQAMLSLDFTALEYDCTDKLNYSYCLCGWDKDWNDSKSSRTANYSSLREGDYIFKVRVSGADGTWSQGKTLLHVIVLPPWYRTWWAYLGYLLMAAGIVIFYLQYARSKWRMRYEVRLAQMETEKEKELIERKLSFFTYITHEFRNPLTLIINPAKDLLAKGPSDEHTDGLQLIHRNAQRLLSLVDQLLLFRKAESGLDQLKLAQADIGELCRQVFLCFVDSARSKEIDYRFERPAHPLLLQVDKEKIEIVLYNLISNALKYTPEKGVVVVRAGESADGQVLLEVLDTGTGIPVEVGDRLFDKFYQFRSSEMTSISGFGIGLYLVKQFVEAHLGKITYESNQGKGTVFQVFLPLSQGATGTATAAYGLPEGLSALVREIAEETPAETPPDCGESITDKPGLLVVDDDPQLLNYVCQIFEHRFILFRALNGEDGLRLAREHRPDLIISDLHMDGISGIEICETIKNDPVLGQTPVILLTASTSANYKLEGVKHGADDYITKPFDRDLLVARVGALLESRNRVEQSIYHTIVHGVDKSRLTSEDKEFLERVTAAIEDHIEDDDFSIPKLSVELGMSHSKIYQKLKDVTGHSLNVFIRGIRLKKAAELFINSSYNVNEVAVMVGISDGRYFREQFHKQFGINPSDYIKKYRKVFSAKYQMVKNVNSPPNS